MRTREEASRRHLLRTVTAAIGLGAVAPLSGASVPYGLEVLGLSIDREADDARRDMRERGYGVPVAMSDARWRAVLGRPRGVPIVCVIGRSVRLEQIEIGEMIPEDVEQLARWSQP